MNAAPGGWYLDGQGNLRYWDGQQWTEHTRAAPPAELQLQASPAPVQPLYPQYQQQNPQAMQMYAQPSAHYMPAQVGTGTNGMATAGFIVGLVSIFLPLFFGLGAGVTGLILSIVGVNRAGLVNAGKGLAIAGIVLASVGILFIL